MRTSSRQVTYDDHHIAEVAKANALVIEDPAPEVLFTDFGASTLDFQLRVHVQRVADLPAVRSQLRFAVNEAFATAGIEIAFPQLDVNLKGAAEAPTTSSSPQDSSA